jgi:hypothetical protein
MIHLMETRSSTQKTPFFRLTSPEKMINRIFNPNSPPNDLSYSEYSQKMTLELRNNNFSPPRWLFNPATTVGKKLCFQSAFCQEPPNSPNRAKRHRHLSAEILPFHSPRHSPRSPRESLGQRIGDGAQESRDQGEEEGGAAFDRGVDTQ